MTIYKAILVGPGKPADVFAGMQAAVPGDTRIIVAQGPNGQHLVGALQIIDPAVAEVAALNPEVRTLLGLDDDKNVD